MKSTISIGLSPCRFAAAALCVLAMTLPRTVSAHGELLIRIAALTRQIEAASNNPARLYLLRGELYREDKNWDAAASDYAQASKLNPNLADVDLCRATMLAESGQLEAAHALFDQVILRSSIDGHPFIGRARVEVKLGQDKAAVADFRRGLKLLRDPEAGCFLELAQALATDGQTNQALHALDDGLQKLGPVLALHTYALELELSQNSAGAALARLDAIIGSAPRKENWLARRGDLLVASGRHDEARKSYEAALAAIKVLPLRLQQNPPMLKLQARVNSALAGITSSPGVGNIAGTSLNSGRRAETE